MQGLINKGRIKDPENLIKEILAGKLFIYPTDTIYGLGCNVLNKESVERIKEIKARDRDKPLSIIAPSFEWITQNFHTNKEELEKYLPGAFTLLLKKKNQEFLPHISNNDRIGIRIPANEFTQQIQKANVPFVTTSVNLSGEPFALTLSDISDSIKNQVDYIVEGKNLSGKPSTLIIDGKIIERK